MLAATKLRRHHITIGALAVVLFIATGPLHVWQTHGATLGARSLQLSDSTAGKTANYILSFAGQSAGTVGSVRVQFCSNGSIIGITCTAPAGFDLSSATLQSQSGMGGFSIDTSDSTANVLVLTRTPGPSVPGNSTYTLSGVVNPSNEGSFFGRIETFSSTNASGSHADYGGVAMAINSQIDITTYVPPYLLFCAATYMPDYSCDTASGDFIDFGELKPNGTSVGQTKLLVATNAANGYTVHMVGTTLTSGNNEIPPMTTNDYSRLGVSQFGLNLVANSTPAIGSNADGPGSGTAAPAYAVPDQYRFNSGEMVASANGVEDYRRYTASYIVNVSKSQGSGVYVSTITYVSLANY